jgi:hypothetical protein
VDAALAPPLDAARSSGSLPLPARGRRPCAARGRRASLGAQRTPTAEHALFDKLSAIFFRWLIPPAIEASPQEHHLWRIGVSGAVAILGAVLALQIAYSFGVTPLGGGFASQEAVFSAIDELTDEVRQARLDDLTPRILSTHRQRCETTDPKLITFLDQQIVEMLTEYARKSGSQFPALRCNP